MRLMLIISLGVLLTSCWPQSLSFKDGSMPEEWEFFYIKPVESQSANIPLNYTLDLSEALRTNIQNNTRLKLADDANDAQVNIEGVIANYTITPVSLQGDDVAAQNRLTVTVNFDIFITAPEDDEMTLRASRFIDYDSDTDLATVESEYLAEISNQIAQDVINKLLSNW